MKLTNFIAAVGLSAVSAIQLKREPLLTWAPTAKASKYPVNYFVPHFGEDYEITDSKKHMRDAEK